MSQHTILISLGSNIEREHYTKQSLVALKQHFADVAVSSVYESEAVGFNGSPFYNAAARATTSKSIEEVCAILKAIEKDNHLQAGNLMLMALFTGMRRGELFKLKWSDIDFDEMTIEIFPKENTDSTWGWQIKDTDSRILPLAEDVVRLLISLQERRTI